MSDDRHGMVCVACKKSFCACDEADFAAHHRSEADKLRVELEAAQAEVRGYKDACDRGGKRIAELEQQLKHKCCHCGAYLADDPEHCPQCKRIAELEEHIAMVERNNVWLNGKYAELEQRIAELLDKADKYDAIMDKKVAVFCHPGEGD